MSNNGEIILQHFIYRVMSLSWSLWKTWDLLECHLSQEGSWKNTQREVSFSLDLEWTSRHPRACGPQQNAWDSTPNQSVHLWLTPRWQSSLWLSVRCDIVAVTVSKLRTANHKDVTGFYMLDTQCFGWFGSVTFIGKQKDLHQFKEHTVERFCRNWLIGRNT